VVGVSTPPTARNTTQGSAVRDALIDAGGFRSAQDIYARLRASGQSVGLTTVYRHLQALADQGRADMIRNPEGEATYRMCGSAAATGHHHHLVCRRCGRAEEIEGPEVEHWARSMAARFGYTDVEHTVEVFGVCANCSTPTS